MTPLSDLEVSIYDVMGDVLSDSDCGICYQPKTIVNLSCCKGLLCEECQRRLRQMVCPFCREQWVAVVSSSSLVSIHTPIIHPLPSTEDIEYELLHFSRIRRRYLRRLAKLRAREIDKERNRRLNDERKMNTILLRIIHEQLNDAGSSMDESNMLVNDDII